MDEVIVLGSIILLLSQWVNLPAEPDGLVLRWKVWIKIIDTWKGEVIADGKEVNKLINAKMKVWYTFVTYGRLRAKK